MLPSLHYSKAELGGSLPHRKWNTKHRKPNQAVSPNPLPSTQGPSLSDPEPIHRQGQWGCSPASLGISSLPCFLYCTILERNEHYCSRTLLELSVRMAVPGLNQSSDPLLPAVRRKPGTLLHNQTPTPRFPSCSLDPGSTWNPRG